MLLILTAVTLVMAGLMWLKPSAAAASGQKPGALVEPEVQVWAADIGRWAAEFGLDPNLAATIMQIESCGNPTAVSPAGAQGLFQVMPFHFAVGEAMQNPDTNARRGLAYLAERLAQTGGDTRQSFAGYNGGQAAAGGEGRRLAAGNQSLRSLGCRDLRRGSGGRRGERDVNALAGGGRQSFVCTGNGRAGAGGLKAVEVRRTWESASHLKAIEILLVSPGVL